MLDEEKDPEEKAPEAPSLSHNPLIKTAAEKIPSLIWMLEINPQATLESTMGIDVPILG